jgi:branched-chain amino acid transport system ATP-binding protein
MRHCVECGEMVGESAMATREKGNKAAAVEALKTEHRNLGQVLNCLSDEIKRIRGLDEKPDLDLLFSIVYYIRVFPDRYHHPKEDEYLFTRLRQRTHEADQVLDELEREHAQFERLLKTLEQALRDYDQRYPNGLNELERQVEEYLEFQRQHMRKEEEHVLPIAEKALRDEDWAAMNNAFFRHDDPMFGENVRTGFEALRNRIVKDTDSRLSG